MKTLPFATVIVLSLLSLLLAVGSCGSMRTSDPADTPPKTTPPKATPPKANPPKSTPPKATPRPGGTTTPPTSGSQPDATVINRPLHNSVKRTPAQKDAATGWPVSPAAGSAQQARIIAWYPIGNSSSDDKDRRIGWNIKKGGWAEFVRKNVEPAIALGFEAVQIHNPGGTLAGEEMQPDQFITAREAGLTWITKGFVEAWRPVTARVPVIAYLGKLPGNERLQGLLSRGDKSGFLRATADCYQLPLDAGMEIAFDALHDVKPNGWELQVFRLLTSMGVRTYVETAPNVVDVELYGANFQIVNTTLDRTLLKGEPWMAPLEKLTGERIILLGQPPAGKEWKDWKEWLGPWMAHWLDQGWSVAINPSNLVEGNIRPRDLADEARRRK